MTAAHSSDGSFSNHVESEMTVQDVSRHLHVQFEVAPLPGLDHQSTMAFIDQHYDNLNKPPRVSSQDARTVQAAHRRSSTVNPQQSLVLDSSNIDLSPVESVAQSIQTHPAASIPNQSNSVEILQVEQKAQAVTQIRRFDPVPANQSHSVGALAGGLSFPTGPGTLPVPGPPDSMPPRSVEFSLMSGNFG